MPVFSEIDVVSSHHSYKVKIHESFDTPDFRSMDFIVIDRQLVKFLGSAAKPQILIEAEEANKNLDSCINVIQSMSNLGINRSSTVVGIGGGLVQDIVTFASSVYMRGIDWIYVPTTMMSVLDSCLGGKSSINFNNKKNLVGTFWPPKEILIFPQILQSLSDEAIFSGLFEGVKICFARSDAAFENFTRLANTFILNRRIETVPELVDLSLKSKKWFVETDEHDKAERQLLNFGHTFGHALEASLAFKIPHGIAIGLGMIAACHYHLAMNNTRVESLVRFLKNCLAMIPEEIAFYASNWNEDLFLESFESDKKHTKDYFVLILPQHESLEKVQLQKSSAVKKEICLAMRAAFLEVSQ